MVSAAVGAIVIAVGVVPAAPALAGTGSFVIASTSDSGVKGNQNNCNTSIDHLAISADGRTVAFASNADNLDPADTDTELDVYVKHLATGDAVLVSTPDSGVNSNGPSSYSSLSADGRTVAFHSSATNLDPADTDETTDAYVWRQAPPGLSIRDRSKAEGHLGVTKFRFRVTLDEASAEQMMVDYTTLDGTAVDPADYRDRSGTLIFAPGQTRATVVVRVRGRAWSSPTSSSPSSCSTRRKR